jgi:hypothetical protein
MYSLFSIVALLSASASANADPTLNLFEFSVASFGDFVQNRVGKPTTSLRRRLQSSSSSLSSACLNVCPAMEAAHDSLMRHFISIVGQHVDFDRLADSTSTQDVVKQLESDEGVMEEIVALTFDIMCEHWAAFACMFAKPKECAASTQRNAPGNLAAMHSLTGTPSLGCFCDKCANERNAFLQMAMKLARILSQGVSFFSQNVSASALTTLNTDMLVDACPFLDSMACFEDHVECDGISIMAAHGKHSRGASLSKLQMQCQAMGVSKDVRSNNSTKVGLSTVSSKREIDHSGLISEVAARLHAFFHGWRNWLDLGGLW